MERLSVAGIPAEIHRDLSAAIDVAHNQYTNQQMHITIKHN